MLEEIARVWREERGKVAQSASAIVERLRALGGGPVRRGSRARSVLDAAVQRVRRLLRPAARRIRQRSRSSHARASCCFCCASTLARAADEPRDMVLVTLRAMALGGMRDHIGGGFHRYSVDADWRVPHFEKMLYDQAQLVLAYVEAAQLTGDPFYADVAADTLAYVRRDLTRSRRRLLFRRGCRQRAARARARDPGRTRARAPSTSGGTTRVRTRARGRRRRVRMRYGVLPDGNAPFDPQHEFTHKNLLYTARPIEEIAQH